MSLYLEVENFSTFDKELEKMTWIVTNEEVEDSIKGGIARAGVKSIARQPYIFIVIRVATSIQRKNFGG